MTQNDQRSDSGDIDAAASQWAVRLQLRELLGAEQKELDGWLAADSRHRGALARARAAWTDLDRLAALSGRGAAPHPPPLQQNTDAVVYPKNRRGPTRRWLLVGAAASLVGAGLGICWLKSRGEVYVSAIGEVRSVTLSDGSGMVLNTASDCTVVGNRVSSTAPNKPPIKVPSPPTTSIAISSNECGVATISGDRK